MGEDEFSHSFKKKKQKKTLKRSVQSVTAALRGWNHPEISHSCSLVGRREGGYMFIMVSLAPGSICTTAFLVDPFFSSPVNAASSADVNAVEVVCSEGGVALGALPLTCVVACLHALEAEDVEALCQYRILHPRVAARTR